jgi:hypothetical protein
MAGKYSGNLVRTYARPDDPTGNWWPDASHGARGHEDDGTDEYPDRHRVPADTGDEYAGADFPDDVTQAPGILLDDPKFDHDGPAILWPVYTDDQYREQLPGAHRAGADRGNVGSQYARPGVQAQGEVYSDFVDEGNVIMSGPNQEGAPNILRGINAYPMNNPEREGYVKGVRPGLFRRLRPDRSRRMQRRRYDYDLQPLATRDNYVPVNTPSPGAPMYGPVFSSWLPGYVGRRETQPAIWRDPGTVDASLLAGSPASGGYDGVIAGDSL